MMEKARTGSGEKKKSTRDAFGDLGIVGGTKRLFMKGRKRTIKDAIFEDYIIESAASNNTINLQVSLVHLNRALRSALNASTASIRLTKKNDIPVLSLTILTNTFANPFNRTPITSAGDGEANGISRLTSEAPNPENEDSVSTNSHPPSFDRETTISQSVPVTVLAPQTVENIHEPTCREPDVHIMLPSLLQLKSISERFVRLASPSSAKGGVSFNASDTTSSRLTLSASSFGEFKIGVSTPALKIESKWSGLVNPALDPGVVEGGEEGIRMHASTRLAEKGREEAWASVRVEGKDWSRVLGVGRLGGRVVACEEFSLGVEVR
ncbi:MAG: hypothetical protein Q9174_006073 [Haloplaca sp. 1 TL-2023]